MTHTLTSKGLAAAVWGVAGMVAFIGSALYRIIPLGFGAYHYPFTTWHWVLLWTWVPAMMWAEGYRGFHQSFSPMFAARARYLAENPKPLHVALAPLFCLGLFHATRRRMISSWVLVVGIAILVALVRLLEQPTRGIIDLGVVMGLSIGTVSMVIWAFRALTRETFEPSPDVPPSE